VLSSVNASSTKRLLAAVAALTVLGAGAFLWRTWREDDPFAEFDSPSTRAVQEAAAKFAAFEAQERHVAETVWAKELLAQDCARTIEALWDSLNAATNKLRLLASFPVGDVVLPAWRPAQALAHGIEAREPAEAGAVLPAPEWRAFVDGFARAGWELAQTEFRHTRFDTDASAQPHQSRFYFAAHLTNPVRSERAILAGDLFVDWAPRPPDDDLTPIKRLDASRLTLKSRAGEPPFRLILHEQFTLQARSALVDTLLLYDLDGDGLSEIVLPLRNRLYRRGADGRYAAEDLCAKLSGQLFTGLIADFDGDGAADLLGEQAAGLVLFTGSPTGRFDQAGRPVWSPKPPLQNTMALTCGDLDDDGDLDLFLAQYRNPGLGQLLRPTYYDANDGHPAFLLLNDGHGSFSDATTAAGLERKRWRRVFSASLVDLDDDGDLDLLVVSDFAGVDLYRNDGRGHFTDVTAEWVVEPHAFGMAHALADFNADGRLDFLMIGMNSPTVDRLEHLGLNRPHPRYDPAMRRRMTFGNRLYLARPGGGFEQTSLNDVLARTGWSWGCSAADFNNDGFPDVYIGNGYETKPLVRDFETEFWLHDLYLAESVDEVTATTYLDAQFSRTRGRGWSYGGYEKNRLFFNQQGASFVEAAHLLGVALEADSRNVVADDLDGDGRLDLLVMTSEVWPERRQTLRVYRNTLGEAAGVTQPTHDGLSARSSSPSPSPAGRGGEVDRLAEEAAALRRVREPAHQTPFAAGDGRGEGERGRSGGSSQNDHVAADRGNWIGFRFREQAARKSPVGVRVTLHSGRHRAVRHLVTGDSFRAQHANTVHFGLGEGNRVDHVEIRWPDGPTLILREPGLNRYHPIRTPEESAVQH
jgi:hypothetical protein